MAVIALPNFSPQGPAPSMTWELRSITARQQSPMNGVARTLERVGASWAATFRYENLVGDRRPILQQFLANCRGHGSRFYAPYYAWTNRGSFPVSELLSNNLFASGTTGWTPGSEYSLTANDGVLKLTRSAVTAAQNAAGQNVTLTQYVPYAARALHHAGRGTFSLVGPQLAGLSASAGPAGGLYTYAGTPLSTGAVLFSIVDGGSSGFMAGDYFRASYASVAQCALVDNGPNMVQRSDEIDNAYWVKTNSTVSANATVAPDGTTTAEALLETGATGGHLVTSGSLTVSSSAADYSITVAVKANNRGFCFFRLQEMTGNTVAQTYVNLSTGAIGTTSTGANWSNLRTFTVALGNGWHAVTIVARKTNAATTLIAEIGAATADGTGSYTGTNLLSAIYLWRATVAQSSVPTRLSQTTSAASSGTSQTGGGLYLKGLPASTSGLLVAGDLAEIVTGTSTQMVRARATLDSDAAGCGYFEFEAPIRVSPSDGAAVIFQRPLCRMMLDSNTVQWTEHGGGFCDLEFTAVEDTYP